MSSHRHDHTEPLGRRPSGRGGSLTDAIAVARPVLQDINVHVLGMRHIGPRSEYRGEPPACGDADGIDRGTQMLISIGLDGQRSTIRELEAHDVDRQTGRVRADLADLCAVAVAAFVTRPRVNRLEFYCELAGNERSDEVAQPMAEPFTELAGKRRLIWQADRRLPPRWQFDGLELHGRRDRTFRVDSRRKRDRLKFDSGGTETIQAGLIDGGRRLGLFRRRDVVWSGMGGRLSRAWRWQWRGRGSGRAGSVQREGE